MAVDEREFFTIAVMKEDGSWGPQLEMLRQLAYSCAQAEIERIHQPEFVDLQWKWQKYYMKRWHREREKDWNAT